jgi:hypothetical protein
VVRIVLPLQSAVEARGGLSGVGQPEIALRSFDAQGRGYDLTPWADGLSWSSVNPGGDEICSFRLAREWFSGAPEVKKGNRLEVQSGPEVLWRGRIEESEGEVDSIEQIGVTAYGSGIALRDGAMTEIYVDAELAAFANPPSVSRQLLLSPTFPHVGSQQVVTEDGDERPAVQLQQTRIDNSAGVRIYFTASLYKGDIPLGYVYFDITTFDLVNNTTLTGAWTGQVVLGDDDTFQSAESTIDTVGDLAPAASGYFTATTDGRTCVEIQLKFDATIAATDGSWNLYGRELRAYGRHGLALQGTDPGGFLGSQIVRDVVGRVAGVIARRIDQSTYVIEDIKFKQPTAHEEAVKDASKFDDVNWGTWGPDSCLDRRTEGHFDWKRTEPGEPHWTISRADCERLSINTELSSLHNAVDVHWTDTAGTEHVTRRTATVPELDEADPPITRVGRVDGGLRSSEGAERLGDVFLALSGSRAPARGDAVISQAVRHRDRGLIAPWFMRADGSNIRIPDVLPSRELLALSREPDRRSTFPIKRVSVDCSGAVPQVSVSVDQAVDVMSQLQAQLGAASERVGQG